MKISVNFYNLNIVSQLDGLNKQLMHFETASYSNSTLTNLTCILTKK